jgi:choline kinase
MKIVFACAGEQTRWGNHLNCAKHLVPVQGKPLLKRNIELVERVFKCGQVYVSIRSEEHKSTYNLTDNICFYVASNIEAGEPWVKTLLPFLSATEEGVLVLLGDVIFSESCVSAMLRSVTKNVFNIYGRKHASSITGGKWGELFALYIPQHFKESFSIAVNAVEQLYTTKEINRFYGWEII